MADRKANFYRSTTIAIIGLAVCQVSYAAGCGGKITADSAASFGADEADLVEGITNTVENCIGKKDPDGQNEVSPPENNGPKVNGQDTAGLAARDELLRAEAEALREARENEEKRKQLEIARENERKRIAEEEKRRAAIGDPYSAGDKSRIKKLDADVEKKRPYPWEIAAGADDPDLRKRLKFISATTEVTEEYKKDYTQLLATIAQLSKMALTNQQAATNMTTAADPNSQGAPSITKAATAPSAKSAKLGEEKSEISEKSADAELESSDGSNLSEEDKTKLKTALEAAKKRKDLLALKKKLKGQLKTASDRKAAEAEEATRALNGDLIPDEPERGLASANPEKEKEEFLNSAVFHAMQAQFSMDGGQTRAEVQRMLDEVEKELGVTGDILAGILGTDSKSLFVRVREVHQQCLRSRCVELIAK